MKLVTVSYEELRERYFKEQIEALEQQINSINASDMSDTAKYEKCSEYGMQISFMQDALNAISVNEKNKLNVNEKDK